MVNDRKEPGPVKTSSNWLPPSLPGPSPLRGEQWKPCRLHQAPAARGAVRFWCSLPTADTSSFVPLELRVTAAASGAPRYRRVIQINEVGKSAGHGGGGGGGRREASASAHQSCPSRQCSWTPPRG